MMMKKLIAILLCLVNVFALLSCEKNETEADETIKNIETTSSENSKENHTPKQYFKLEQKGFGYYYEIYDKQGDVVLAKESSRPTEITMLGETIVDIKIGMGTGLAVHTYYDVEGNRFSEEYTYVAAASGNLVAYVDGESLNDRTLVVRDIFDREIFYKSFCLDFAPAVDTPIESAVFTENENELEVVYLSERPATPLSITLPIRRNASEGEKYSEEERAMQAYEAVWKNEIKLIYLTGNEYYLTELYNFYYPLMNPKYALVDMDGDAIDEMVILKGDDEYFDEKFVLHYENEKVYGFSFQASSMQTLFTDGSFNWRYDGEPSYTCGNSRLTFLGEKLKFYENHRIEDYDRYYIAGKKVNDEIFEQYLTTANERQPVEFTSLLNAWWENADAKKIASEYWGVEDGGFDEKTGYRYMMEAFMEKTEDGVCWRIKLYWFVNNLYYDYRDSIWVDINTGEISSPTYPNPPYGKG